jgi:endoglucanase
MSVKKNLVILLIFFFVNSISYCGTVFINQEGYAPSFPKMVYCSSSADSFFVVEASTGSIYYRGPLQFFTNSDPATGMMIYRGNFSSLTREGVYYIRTSSNDSSYLFRIYSNIYDNLFRKSLKAFYFQRCGTALSILYAGGYNRSSCHTSDGNFHSSTGQSGFHQSTRGWHDAGDYGKYIVNAGITAGTLLMAYEQFPGGFSADNLNIPESGNGIPDLLDEVKYEIEWFLTMQAAGGGIYFKVTPEQFEPFVMPSQATAQRFIHRLSTTATGNFIAVLARFSRLYKSYDSTFSNQCLQAAVNAWNYLDAQTGIVPAGGFHNPPGTVTGEYGDGNDADERLWAAAELFETTGEAVYKDFFDFSYNIQPVTISTMWWGNVMTLAHLTYLFSKQPSADNNVKTHIHNALSLYCNQLLNKRNANAFNVSINPGEYSWGSNSTVLNNAVILIYGYEKSGNIDYRNAALDQLNYILGVNGTSYSFVTGIGEKRVLHPHHRPSYADGISDPVPGLLAGGPNQYLNDPVLQQYFNSSTPPALCYIDNWESYASNEVAINWNAPLVFVSGYFNSSTVSSIKGESELNIPLDFKLYQNFPNPFNPVTTIKYALIEKTHVRITILDISGEEKILLLDESINSGYHTINFNAEAMPSGVYFCRMQAGSQEDTIKMLLVK